MGSHILRGLLLCLGILAASPAFAGVNTWTSAGPEGGRIYNIVVVPAHPGTAYAATDGGLFKTTDAGQTWTGLHNGLPRQEVWGLAVSPHDPSVVYAGVTTNPNAGLFKSTDGGETWSRVIVNGPPSHSIVTAITVDPVNPGVIYVGTSGGGLFKSTDGGVTWSAPAVQPASSIVENIVVNPQIPSIVYAAFSVNGLYKSTDGGATWSAVNMPTSSTNAYDVVMDSGTLFLITNPFLYRSNDGGVTWLRCAGGLLGSVLFRTLAVDPSAPGTIYASAASGTGSYVIRSTDSGATWTDVTANLPQVSWGIFALAVDPAAPVLYAGHYNVGIYRSTDGAASWDEANVGLIASEVIDLAAGPAGSSLLYAGGPDGEGIHQTSNGGATWQHLIDPLAFGFDTFVLAVDPQNPLVAYAGGARFHETLARTVDGGVTWTNLYPALEAALQPPVNAPVHSIAIDPITPATVYAGSNQGLARSSDGGTTWTNISGPIYAAAGVTQGVVGNLTSDPSDPSVLYATTAGQLYRTTDAGATWTVVPTPGTGNPQAFTLAPSSPSILYVIVASKIYRSDNGGATWTNPAPSENGRVLAIDPNDPYVAYKASNWEVFRSNDGGATWTPLGPGMEDVQDVRDLVIDPDNLNTIYAVTWGSGIYSLTQVANQPDLVMNEVTPNAPLTVNAGSTLSVTDTVENQGGVSSGSFRIAYHLSTDMTYGNSDDVASYTIRVVTNPFAGGATSMATTTLDIPDYTPGGTYYLCSLADSLNQVAESNETNNTLCSTVLVTVPFPDLIISQMSTAATTVRAGRSFRLAFTITNQGGSQAYNFVTAFHLSTDATYGGSDDISIKEFSLPLIMVGGHYSNSFQLVVPRTTPSGTYYVCGMTDTGLTVTELNETNNSNCTATTITVP